MFIKEIDNNEKVIKKDFYASLLMTIFVVTLTILKNVFFPKINHITNISIIGDTLIFICLILFDVMSLYKYLVLKLKKAVIYFISKKVEIFLKNISIIMGISGIIILNINIFI
ncbi:hypothetical protein [Anaerocolumna xylanovorans]|uniref:Uncharacterized protein n=1 Tax=Anaerocolumna xylanovorans DSM 12503 TaxID=1121345 RepID=A0A1M7YGI3_9FIRM|nr:hypothetical protein [Anaerocolumna xylanovorans]SHO51742.1 hypothetical protein SAMN02745217_03306 [Anaerocolumna xylanovorans DSM 12503]